jgi:geranylgeranyl diphosphate synthase type I
VRGRAEGPAVRTPGAADPDPVEPDPEAVDADVPGAVGRVLDGILEERTRQVAGLDETFARDVARRVARFALLGGKRTRSRFLWWALRTCGGPDAAVTRPALRVAAALELIQTCALVHDDVMDGSAMRRGRPTLHEDLAAQYAGAHPRGPGVSFGSCAAILAGDLALAWADDVVADTGLPPSVSEAVRAGWSAMRTEMVAGQYLDVLGRASGVHSVEYAVHVACLKSALYSVERPLALGAALAGADAGTVRALRAAGRSAGLAFQLRDDLADVFGTPGLIGKPVGGDIREGRPTYLVAVARARAEARGDHRALAVLDRNVGAADAGDCVLDEVRHVLDEVTGARAAVETRIERLVRHGVRLLPAAPPGPEPAARRRLRELLCEVAGVAPAAGDAAPDTDGTPPMALLLDAVAEGGAQ